MLRLVPSDRRNLVRGRQTQAIDAAGTTTFAYDAFGSLTNETVVGVAGTNTIERFSDAFGRDAGYALNGVRQSTLGYDPATGRLTTMLAAGNDTPFTWTYLPGSDLKSSLAYPNGLTASWQYDAKWQLLQVCNAFPTNIISQYDYTYDAAGRRVSCGRTCSAFEQNDTLSYGYNNRSELTNAVASVDSNYRYGYDFDDIGNRKTSAERGTNSVYTASQLNQYTAVDDFTPVYDADGNQTLVKTATGIWQVSYNGENRPILWAQGTNTISMSFDRMGRRVTKNDQRFVYNDYLQIANNIGNAYVWDCTENVATRPLVWVRSHDTAKRSGDGSTFFYTHDGNKNVSDVIATDGSVSAHYGYAPFGTLTAQTGVFAAANPFRFSSEFAEDDTTTIYYNYRHLNIESGCWCSRDRYDDYLDFYGAQPSVPVINRFCDNNPILYFDALGNFGVAPLGVLPNASVCCADMTAERRPFREVIGNGATMPCCPGGTVRAEMSNCTCLGCALGVDVDVPGRMGSCLPDAANDGPGDALRHCVWSCMMSRRCGNWCAFLAGWGHENFNPFPWSNRMDISNNAVGRDVGSMSVSCGVGCLDKLYSGQLTYINYDGTNPMPLYQDALRCILR